MAESIKMTPLAGWTTHTLPQKHLLLTLDVIPSEQALQTGERLAYRVPMSSSQACELAAALLTGAEAAEMGQAPPRERN